MGWKTPRPDPDEETNTRRHWYAQKVELFAWLLNELGAAWNAQTRDRVASDLLKHKYADLIFSEKDRLRTPATLVRHALNQIGLTVQKFGEGNAKFRLRDLIGVGEFEYHLDQQRRLIIEEAREVFFGDAFTGNNADLEAPFRELMTGATSRLDLWPEETVWNRKRNAKRLWSRMNKRGCGVLGQCITLGDDGVFTGPGESIFD
jgi:hypothetical protein